MAKRHDKLQIILDNYVTKQHLEEVLDKKDYVTKDYLEEALDRKMLEQRLEYERHIGALIEDFRSDMKVSQEGFQLALALFSRESELNKAEHEGFDGRLCRLEPKAF